MKVTGLETVRLDEHPQMLWLQVHTDEGIVGLGETCIGPATVEAHIHETIAPYLVGKDPLLGSQHWHNLSGAFLGYQGTGAEARGLSAADVALWDIRGQALGRPIAALLGGASRESIRIYNTCAGYTYGRGTRGALRAADRGTVAQDGIPGAAGAAGPYEDLQMATDKPAELAQQLLDQGITAMKIWPFDPYAAASGGYDIRPQDLRAGVGVITAIREAVGDAMDIMLEMHAVWHLSAALKIAKAVEPLGVYWFEDPVKADNLAAAATFASSTHIPVAMGETLAGLASFRTLLEMGAAQVIMFDLGWVGGLTEAGRIASLAQAYDLAIAPHDCTGPVVLTASAHLVSNAPNALMQETVRAYYSGWYRDVVTELPAIGGGQISPPRGPGLGTQLRPGLTTSDGARTMFTGINDL
jgi:L-alanine-DL-glutamate epimerase-like enolase superfamily enzyme